MSPEPSFWMSPQKWVKETNAIGIISKERLMQLNNTAISQMKSLVGANLQKRLKP